MGVLRDLDRDAPRPSGDAGCTAGEEVLHAYVEFELAGKDPARVYPGTAIHLRVCESCQPTIEAFSPPRVSSATPSPSEGRICRLLVSPGS
jgi:hypothetical protein